MRPSDVSALIHFNTAPSTYIWGSPRKVGIIAFLHGYMAGTDKQCAFLDELSLHIAKRYRIKASSGGWVQQIEAYAQKHSITWVEAYFLLSSEVLNAALRKIGKLPSPEVASSGPPEPTHLTNGDER